MDVGYLEHFRVAVIRVRMRAASNLILPPDALANILRGSFGRAFRHVACRAKVPVCCETCERKTDCAYAAIFESRPPSGSQRLSTSADIPRPFVIRPPLIPRFVHDAGSSLEFDICLFGVAIDSVAYFVAALRCMAEEGLGPGRRKLTLNAISSLNPSSGPDQDIYDCRTGLITALPAVSTITQALDRNPWTGQTEITLEFMTPTELRFQDRTVTSPDFHHVFKRVRDRISAISFFHCGKPLDINHRMLGIAAESVKTTGRALYWDKRMRRSSRSHLRHDIGGFRGSLIFQGDFGDYWPLLVLGQYTHVGKHTVWGNGQYRICR